MSRFWAFNADQKGVRICTPLFFLHIFADAPCFYAAMIESGIRVGILPIPPNSKYEEIGFRWFYEAIWKQVSLFDCCAGKCDRLGNHIR